MVQDKNGNEIKLGSEVITDDGYIGNVFMFGEDNSTPPKSRLLVSLSVGSNTISGRKKGYYPEQLEIPCESSLVECSICTHRWVAVRPKNITKLECPNCSNTVVFENIDL